MKHFDLVTGKAADITKNSFAALLFLCILSLFNDAAAQPTITSVSTYIDSIGSSVTITGTNFNTTPANNIVYFGATQATVTSASTTSLAVTVPAGAIFAPVTVNNTATNLMAYSQYAFLPNYNNSAFIPGTINFDGHVNFEDTISVSSNQLMVITDIDGDGKADIVILNGHSFSVYRNTSVSGSITNSSFAAPVNVYIPHGLTFGLAAGDIDGDGKPDIAVSINGTDSAIIDNNNIYVFQNTSTPGAISFGSAVIFAELSDQWAYTLAIADIDGDGKADLVLSNSAITVLRNTATVGIIDASSFATQVSFPVGEGDIYNLVVGDLDGDGKLDVVVGDDQINALYVLRNTSVPGNVNFATPVSFATGIGPWGPAICDIDGDGKPDLVVTNLSDNTLSVLHNTSTTGAVDSSSFAAQVVYPTGISPQYIGIGDFDGDGKPDIAVVDLTGAGLGGSTLGHENITLYHNKAVTGTIDSNSLAREVENTGALGLESIATGDMDGDGKTDLVVFDGNLNAISVLRNDPLLPPPTITSVSPYIDSTGTAVTISGTNFNATAANNIVYFGATKATVNSASTTSVNVTVPVGATYAPVSVNNTLHGQTTFSQYPFLPDYNNSAYVPGQINFDPEVNFAGVGGKVLITDIDGDGKADIISIGNTSIDVYLNTSSSGSITSSSFGAPTSFTIPAGGSGIAAGDIDGDGKPDLIFDLPGYMFLMRNTSTPGVASFASPVSIIARTTMGPTPAIGITDIDGDGKADVVTPDNGDENLSLYQNTAKAGSLDSGSLAYAYDIPTYGLYSPCIAITDIDGDGKPDVVVIDWTDKVVQILRNTSQPGNFVTAFAAPVSFAVGTMAYDVVARDIDGDGKPDIAVVNEADNTISVLHNNSTPGIISFSSQVVFTTGSGPISISAGDFDGDGKPDLAVANSGDNTVSVFRNTVATGSITTSSFASPVNLSTGPSGPFYIAVGDMDGDGKADIISSNSDGSISVLRNDPLLASGITGNASICMGSTSTLSDANVGGIWSSGATSIATVGSTGVVTSMGVGTTTISYTTGGYTATKVVTIDALANVDSIGGIATVCVGVTINLTDAADSGSWSSGATAIATVGSIGNVLGVAAGTVTISYTVTNGCNSATATDVVTVNPLPSSIVGTAFVCTGSTTDLSDAVTGGTWTSGSTSIASIASGVVSGVNEGTAIVTYTLSTGCSATTEVTVNPTPTAISGPGSVCMGSTIILSDGIGSGTWSSSSTTIATISATSGSINGVTGGVTTISYQLATGCYTTTIVTVNTLPNIATAASVNCGGVYTLNGSGAGAGGTYLWAPSTGLSCGSCATTEAMITSTTSYTVTGTDINGCSNTDTVTINGNRISGFITMTTAPTDTLKVWLIQFNSSDSSLIAQDSTLTCMDSETPYYEFDNEPSGAYMVKAKLLSGIPGASGYVPTYGLSTILWSSSSTISHINATDTQHINMIYGTVPSGPGFIGGLISEGAGRGTSAPIPVPGILVYLEDTMGNILTYTYTNTAGIYSFGGLAYGAYTVYPVDYHFNTIPWVDVTLSEPADSNTAINFFDYSTLDIISPANSLSIPQIMASTKVILYPNPMLNELYVQSDMPGVFYFYSIDGKEIGEYAINKGITSITISNELAAGVYMGTFKDNDGNTTVFKIVKE